MNSSYEYDSRAETWPVFALAVLSVAVVPLTIGSLSNCLKKCSLANKADDYSVANDKVKSYRSKADRRGIWSKRFGFLLFGWLAIAGLVYHISITEVQAVGNVFDPYEILGIEFGSTDREIKSHFRKLSVKFHPDKIAPDATEELKQEMEEKFVMISKAYKALTDEITKENYEKYGHPDGPQETSHGIALPKFLVEGKLSSPVLLLAYILVIGVFLPMIVSNWWNSTKSYTKKGIHNKTANSYVEKLLNWNPSQLPKLSDILSWISESYELSYFGTPEQIEEVFQKYFARKELTDKEYTLISKVPSLLIGFVDIAAGFRNTELSLQAINALKHFSQATTATNKADIQQLPNVAATSVSAAGISKLGKLFTLPEKDIQTSLDIKDATKFKQALYVASKIPHLQLLKAEFKVPGESVVTPASNSYISVKFLVKSAQHKGLPNLDPPKIEETDTLETLRNPYKIVTDQPQLPAAVSPYAPVDRQASYVALVILQKDGKVAENPSIFYNLSLNNLSLTQEEWNSGEKVEVGTFKIPLTQPTPGEVGQYQFRVLIKSLDYFTNDIDTTIIMNVQQPPKVEEVVVDGKEYESSDDESDDEDDEKEEDDFTDIDTDTDVDE